MDKNTLINKFIKDLRAHKSIAELNAETAYLALLQNKEFSNADKTYRAAVLDLSKAKYTKVNLDVANDNYKTASNNRLQVIEKLGCSVDALTPKYSCMHCKDTGYINGKLCKCIEKRYKQYLQGTASPLMKFKFEDCNVEKINNSKQRNSIASLYRKMKEFCEKFPNTKFSNIVLMGPTGTGKTCVLSAIGNELITKGYSVKFISAFDFNNLMLKYHTAPLDERSLYLDEVIEPDFLIIDDLGTENILKNVTCEYLLNMLSTRISNNKHTAFSTNLSVENICDKYGERFYSRLFNKTYTLAKVINGDDLRIN